MLDCRFTQKHGIFLRGDTILILLDEFDVATPCGGVIYACSISSLSARWMCFILFSTVSMLVRGSPTDIFVLLNNNFSAFGRTPRVFIVLDDIGVENPLAEMPRTISFSSFPRRYSSTDSFSSFSILLIAICAFSYRQRN